MILLEEMDTEFGTIKIVRSKDTDAITYYQNGCSHSEVDMEGISTCAYVHVMYSIIRQSMARRVLMIGCAGGTLATMLHNLGCEVTVADINPHAFILARRYFNMPKEITCVAEDGLSFLLNAPHRYDAIAIDAFTNSGDVSQQFTLPDFFRATRKVVGNEGIVVMNVIVSHDFDLLADRTALNMETAGMPAVLFDWSQGTDRNIIIAGGNNIESMRVNIDGNPPLIRHELQYIASRKRRQHRSMVPDTSPPCPV